MHQIDKYHKAISLYEPIEGDVSAKVQAIIDKHYKECYTPEVLKLLYSCIDLTTLMGGDTDESVTKMVAGVNDFETNHPDIPNVAAICVYPALVPTVKATLTCPDVRIASVAAGFPASQTFPEIKVAEVSMAVAEGANEVDVVLNLNRFLSEDYDGVCTEIEELKDAARGAHLKVIIESGLLADPRQIQIASILSLYSGADFIKTSTGKEYPGASLEAVYVMCQTLRKYYELHGERRGFKASGGVRTPEDVVKYYCIVKEILGEEWLTPELFRLGASSLGKNLLKAIEG